MYTHTAVHWAYTYLDGVAGVIIIIFMWRVIWGSYTGSTCFDRAWINKHARRARNSRVCILMARLKCWPIWCLTAGDHPVHLWRSWHTWATVTDVVEAKHACYVVSPESFEVWSNQIMGFLMYFDSKSKAASRRIAFFIKQIIYFF